MVASIRPKLEISAANPESRAAAAARPPAAAPVGPSQRFGNAAAAGATLDANSPEAEALQATGIQNLLRQSSGAISEALTPTLTEPLDAAAGATLDASSQEGKQLIAQLAAAGGPQGSAVSRSTTAAAPLLPVENWDRYELLKLLGQGGMGAVYKARDRKLGRIVALKFIRGNDEQMSARFLQEARTQSKIDHPGICKVHEVGEVDGKPYIAMQFVDGAALSQLAGKLSIQEKVAIIRDAAVAMHAAHQLGIIHRDIKPANVMVEARPGGYRPIVMDFGLAREATENRGLTESGAVMGTPAFMSPEQARGDVRNLDRRTDVYSLGATLFDLLAGGPPFTDDSVVNVILKVLTHEAPALSSRVPELPKALDVITNKCLAKEPKERYQTAAELAADLDRFLEQKQILGKKVSLRSRLLWKARTNRPLAAAVLGCLLTVLGFLGYGVRTYVQNLRKERAAKRQAELAQRLGQEMKDMEWLLRTARGMPLHDLGREKKIVRQRMLALQSEFAGFGAAGQSLAHYALGRGHMGLHEYPEALKELELAIAQGFQQGEAYYALGVVLGKHYEKAMYEARLAGGGDWARKRLKEIEPQYLMPAVTALRRARQSKGTSPQFLEALIAYYVRDFSAALGHTRLVLEQTPWLYEAYKLTGDIHLELALQARDHGQDQEAGREFTAAVQSFSAAAEIGRSDGEIYEGLAETWVRTIEMVANSGQPVTSAYAAAVAASNQIIACEPESTAGPLKKAYASLMTLGLLGSGSGSAERAQACVADAQDVLRRQADNPYASDVYAGCLAMAAEGEQAAGKDPVPLLQKALGQLEPAVQKAPHFLWGLNDLANVYLALGSYQQLHGDPAARHSMLKSVEYRAKAVALDESYVIGYQNALYTWANLIPMITSRSELQSIVDQASQVFGRCTKINSKDVQCFNNYFQVYAAAAQRLLAAGQDAQPMLVQAMAILEQARQLGAKFLDTEQADALSQLVDAMDKLRRKQTPAPALQKMQEALTRCFTLAAQDPVCGALAAQGGWVRGDWATLSGMPAAPILQAAREQALRATQSAPSAADAWWVLAETELRLARSAPPPSRAPQIAQGLAAVEKLFAIDPNHARGLATHGSLVLLRAQSETGETAVRASAEAAAQSLARAVASDAFLAQELAPLRAQAQRLSRRP